MPRVVYKPTNAWVGDVIPYHWNGQYYLYYLHDPRSGMPGFHQGTSWHLVTTRDFLHYEEHGAVLPHGSLGDQDLNAYTGCIVARDGTFHMFYTGHNPHPPFVENGQPLQAVMHAVSHDLIHWEKCPEHTFYADGERYERHDWRDPFVFYNEDVGEYWMLLAARLTRGADRRRGCIALCTSRDLKSWTIREPFWNPGLYVTHECPELFRQGDWWYLIYSDFSERFATHYRMSRNLHGPWTVPPLETLDGRAFYAAKTASDGLSRYAFGWIATRENNDDRSPWQWAGELAVHELAPHPDGTFAVRVPRSIHEHFQRSWPTTFTPVTGDWRSSDRELSVCAPDSYAAATLGSLPDQCRIHGQVTFQEATRALGVALFASADLDQAHFVRLEPPANRLVLDTWPRVTPGPLQWHIAGDRAHTLELERPIPLEPGVAYDLEILIDGSACIAYLGGEIAMSARLHHQKEVHWGIFVSEGQATFQDFRISVPSPERTS